MGRRGTAVYLDIRGPGTYGFTVAALARFALARAYKSARMYARHADAGRTDPDYYERSPSTGAEETAITLNARDGYDHEPPSDDGDDERVTIDAVPPADTDTDTDTDAAPRSHEVFA